MIYKKKKGKEEEGRTGAGLGKLGSFVGISIEVTLKSRALATRDDDIRRSHGNEKWGDEMGRRGEEARREKLREEEREGGSSRAQRGNASMHKWSRDTLAHLPSPPPQKSFLLTKTHSVLTLIARRMNVPCYQHPTNLWETIWDPIFGTGFGLGVLFCPLFMLVCFKYLDYCASLRAQRILQAYADAERRVPRRFAVFAPHHVPVTYTGLRELR
jgi:hypothetical protein